MSSSSSTSPTKSSRPRNTPAATNRPPPPYVARPPLPGPPPLLLTVRFSTSLPDLQLDIPHPGQTTVVALKHLIRTRLSAPNATRRLRFIHGGKILPDAAVLSSVLRAPPPPPQSGAPSAAPSSAGVTSARDGGADPKGKGKAVEGREATPQRVYVNCSIGDALTEAELAAEKRLAETPAASPGSGAANGAGTGSGRAQSSGVDVDSGAGGAGGARPTAAGQAAQPRAPRGFDRLLSAGFSGAEVNQLRLQFRSIQAARHTPDTMPSPDTLRSMEDAWIDNNNGGISNGGGGTGGGAGGEDGPIGEGGEDGFGMSGLLDVLLRGMMIGFMWPLGSFGWLVREEGIWSRRWQVFVSLGCILSLTIGMIRAISGDR